MITNKTEIVQLNSDFFKYTPQANFVKAKFTCGGGGIRTHEPHY